MSLLQLLKHKSAACRGQAAEEQALAYLQRQGMQLVERNFSCRCGEIDLIMREKQTLVFVEVRQRSSRRFGGALASVTVAKQARLWQTASFYLQQFARPPACRFDLVAIDGNELSWLQDIICQ